MIDSALETAAAAHQNQFRKGTDIPYITHPCAVALLLCEAGCPARVIAAGILHDILEDTPLTLDSIQKKFGDEIAAIVEGCSEPDRALPWEERKEHTLESLKTAPEEVRLVSCADKLHNIRTIAAEQVRMGDRVWERFNRGREKQAWYYRGLVGSLRPGGCRGEAQWLFDEFEEAVKELFPENY